MPSITFPSGSILAPTVLDLSSNLASIYSVVCANSADWGSVDPSDQSRWDSSYDTVSSLSGDWNNVYSAVLNNSGSWSYDGSDIKALTGDWSDVYSTVLNNSGSWSYDGSDIKALTGNWNDVYATVSSLSFNWDSAYALLTGSSANWDSAYTTIQDVSSSFGDSLTWVRSNSSTMYVDRLGINTDISLLSNNLKLAVQGDTVIYGNLSSLGTTTLVNVTANVTDALSVVNPGFGSLNAIYISQGGPGAGIKMDNAGSGPMMTLEGNGNVGIGTGTPNEKLTVNGKISSNNIIYALGGDSNQWNSSTTLFASSSSLWQSNFVTTSASSGRWNTAYNTLTSTSGNWNSTYTSLTANSANWTNTFSVLTANSGVWTSSRNILTANSATWNASYTNLTANSANWTGTFSVLTANSGAWNSTRNTLTANSASWSTAYTNLTANSSNWNSSFSVLTANSGDWNTTRSAVTANSANWNSASINYIIDGGSVTVTTGSKGVIYMPTGFKVTNWRVMAETETTAKIDIRRFTNNTYKTTSLSSDSILLDKTDPQIRNLLSLNASSSAVGTGTIFRDISALDTLEFYVEENDFARRFTVALAGYKTT